MIMSRARPQSLDRVTCILSGTSSLVEISGRSKMFLHQIEVIALRAGVCDGISGG